MHGDEGNLEGGVEAQRLLGEARQLHEHPRLDDGDLQRVVLGRLVLMRRDKELLTLTSGYGNSYRSLGNLTEVSGVFYCSPVYNRSSSGLASTAQSARLK